MRARLCEELNARGASSLELPDVVRRSSPRLVELAEARKRTRREPRADGAEAERAEESGARGGRGESDGATTGPVPRQWLVLAPANMWPRHTPEMGGDGWLGTCVRALHKGRRLQVREGETARIRFCRPWTAMACEGTYNMEVSQLRGLTAWHCNQVRRHSLCTVCPNGNRCVYDAEVVDEGSVCQGGCGRTTPFRVGEARAYCVKCCGTGRSVRSVTDGR